MLNWEHRLCLGSERVLKKKGLLFGVFFLYLKKIGIWPPVSGATGLQIVSGQVKMKKKVCFQELEFNL